MPYNTRHKSLSLSSLGIHVPVTYAERAAARSASKETTVPNRTNKSHPNDHQNKRLKTAHPKEQGASVYSRASPESLQLVKVETSRPDVGVYHDNTPPHSPSRAPSVQADENGQPGTRKVDIEGINDYVVEAVISQLETAANRPHSVKELVTALSPRLADAEQSASPSAIISSRLSAYMKRPYWSALAPCPIGKETSASHPQRTYFYLTTYPHRYISDLPADHFSRRTFISPSISGSSSACSFSGEDEDDGCDYTRQLSPSPDVDLSPATFDDAPSPTTPLGSLPCTSAMSRCHRSASPPLEKDEREFTQTADGLHKRKLTADALAGGYGDQLHIDDLLRDDAVFDEKQSPAPGAGFSISFTASPAVRASFPASCCKRDFEMDHWPKIGKFLEWDPNPEDIELDELDYLLETY